MTASAHLPVAILDTSFWVAAYACECAANMLDVFQVIVPEAVEREILARSAVYPTREFPDQTLFRHLRHLMQSQPDDLPPPLPIFGAGEATAIALAQHRKAQGKPARLLINEYRAAEYARARGLSVMTAPSLVVLLRARGIISDRASRVKLERLAPMTPPAFLQDAARVLDALRHT